MQNNSNKLFTIIANTSTPVLHLGIGNNATARIFSELINGSPNSNKIKLLQIASQEFKDRLNLLDKFGERIYKMKEYFNNIPTGQHFLFLPIHIEDRILIYEYAKQLSELDKVSLKSDDLERISLYLSEHYEVYTFGNERRSIGLYPKTKRVCRFCGRSIPEVSFKQKAHAISESLGNKKLICLEECDDCNHRFNQHIEQDISHYFQFSLLLKRIKGKNGNRTIQGDGISITNDTSSREVLGRDTLVLKVKDWPDTNETQKVLKSITEKEFGFSNIKYVPQNIYKCFCKYVLSVIDYKLIPHFQKTINWINEPLTQHHLPPVWYYSVANISDAPYLIVMIRKHSHKEIPYCWAIISIAGNQYLFIIPFCTQDKYKFVGKSRINYFLEGLKNIMPNINLQSMKLDDIKPTSLQINLNINISPDCVEGRDYYFKKQLGKIQ